MTTQHQILVCIVEIPSVCDQFVSWILKTLKLDFWKLPTNSERYAHQRVISKAPYYKMLAGEEFENHHTRSSQTWSSAEAWRFVF